VSARAARTFRRARSCCARRGRSTRSGRRTARPRRQVAIADQSRCAALGFRGHPYNPGNRRGSRAIVCAIAACWLSSAALVAVMTVPLPCPAGCRWRPASKPAVRRAGNCRPRSQQYPRPGELGLQRRKLLRREEVHLLPIWQLDKSTVRLRNSLCPRGQRAAMTIGSSWVRLLICDIVAWNSSRHLSSRLHPQLPTC
jgi:hypothetical protein